MSSFFYIGCSGVVVKVSADSVDVAHNPDGGVIAYANGCYMVTELAKE